MTEQELEERARKAKNEYQRQWAKGHPDNVRKNNAAYWRRKALKELQKKDVTSD